MYKEHDVPRSAAAIMKTMQTDHEAMTEGYNISPSLEATERMRDCVDSITNRVESGIPCFT